VEEDSEVDSHDSRLSRLPRRSAGADDASGVELGRVWFPIVATARTRPSGITASMPGDDDMVGARDSFRDKPATISWKGR
jgi:hypothetical protein